MENVELPELVQIDMVMFRYHAVLSRYSKYVNTHQQICNTVHVQKGLFSCLISHYLLPI